MNKTILIIGATGTIGAYTALNFKQQGYNVIAVGRRQTDNGFFQQYDIEYRALDISKQKHFKRLSFNSLHAIIHLAGTMPATMVGYDPYIYINDIIVGTLNVLDFAVKCNVPKIIFAQSRADSSYLMGSSQKIPSDIEKKFPLNSDHSVYAIAKNTAVDLIEHFYHKHGIKRFVFRLPTIYAYHPNKFFFVDGVKKKIAYKQIIEQAIKGETIEIWGDRLKAKEISYVDDLVQCFQLAIESELDGGMYNFGRGVGVTIEEQIRGIIEIFSPKYKLSKVIYRPDKPDSRQFIHDISKTKSELGYDPKYDYIALLKAYKKEMEENRFEKLWGKEEDYE